jgi:5'-3' exonuclease
MGIPSFYKHLLQSIQGLTSPTHSPPAVFALDLNCAIYHCVHGLLKRDPYDPARRSQWEKRLIEDVISYIKHMVRSVNPTETVYVAVDGVAPMAKIRQQRMRRFKSAAAADEEARIRAEARGIPYSPQPRWDTNAITPGTAFMATLARELRAYAKTDSRVIVSPADEPGEGEQKIMAWMRAKNTKDCVVYGLDADLIVLALWSIGTASNRVDLYREEVEFSGKIKLDAHGNENFLYLDTTYLAKTLYETYAPAGTTQSAFLQDFVGLMSLLGNDFVPHGMGLKIRNDGIEYLLEHYKAGKFATPIVLDTNYSHAALVSIFQQIAADEPAMMLKGIIKKRTARVGYTQSKEPEDQALARYNDTPVQWDADGVLVREFHIEGYDKPKTVFKDDWQSLYDTQALMGCDVAKVTQTYVEALTWTLAYYAGAPVDNEWYYPWCLPPRATSVVAYLHVTPTLTVPNTKRTPLEPVHQLAMVLPQTSFDLLPPEYAALIEKHPYAWPTAYESYSLGRRFLWECEPLIPMIQPAQMRAWAEELYD